MRARKCKGFGWKRWSKEWLHNVLGLFNGYRTRYYEPQWKVAPACGWRIVNSRMIPRDSSSCCDCWPALPCTSQEAKCAYVGGPMEGIRFKDDCMNDC
jgi:hypothetical protein